MGAEPWGEEEKENDSGACVTTQAAQVRMGNQNGAIRVAPAEVEGS